MSGNLMMRLVLACFCGGLVALCWNYRLRAQGTNESMRLYSKRKYGPVLNGLDGLAVITAVMVLTAMSYSPIRSVYNGAVVAAYLAHVTVYFMVLSLLMPFLRERVDAVGCSLLWVMPYLFYLPCVNRMLWLRGPLLAVKVPRRAAIAAAVIWAVGAAGVMLWYVISHLRFRHRVLASAHDVEGEEAVMRLWMEENRSVFAKRGDDYNPLRLVRSPEVKAPLSVGLLKGTTVVVLPEGRAYSLEELRMIFRHELIHISRRDSSAKLFMAICRAVNWFNPFIHRAMLMYSGDLELSCDQLVTETMTAGERQRYAGLILDSACDERGFTTCLSSEASGLRYRLKNIVTPKRKRAGGLVAGVICACVFFLWGFAAVAYGGETADRVLFPDGSDGWEVISASVCQNGVDKEYEISSEDFISYLSSVRLYRLAGNYDYDEYGKGTTITVRMKYGKMVKDMLLTEGTLWVRDINTATESARVFYRHILFDTVYYTEDIDTGGLLAQLSPIR